jgi:hypothetical protein
MQKDAETLSTLAVADELPPTQPPPAVALAQERDPGRQAKAQEIKMTYQEGVRGIVRAAILLRALKEEIVAGTGIEKVEGYREFRRFCDLELGWPKSFVNRLVDVASAFGGYLDLVVWFDVSALYTLSRVPQATLEQALELAREGKFVSNKLAAELVRSSQGPGAGRRRKAATPKEYRIPVSSGAVVVAAPHRTLMDVRAIVVAALAEIESRIAKRRRGPGPQA